ncbi:hypothetical protein SAMN05216347_101434 [Streptococcus equinus]|uniref:DUF1648 domain-containing protein n=1 Tax=Streptococcus equinus TaxID=1335 RepID=A0A1H0KMA8_STREI|nr:hypothetical protein [Streptococcus equinus]SDO56902.1 hypothetical protein SAMN05216347_101434 [Streptococcus equinus]
MKRFSTYIRLLYVGVILVTIILAFLSPKEIALHFNNSLVDESGSKTNLFIYPIFTVILGEGGILWSKWYRSKLKLKNYPILLSSEIKFIQTLSLLVLIFILAMLHQVF